VRQLTTTLLRRDFGLNMELPDDRLCPPVPNRLSYVVWIKSLIESDGPAVGLDIGTGASCIYPLLACVQRPHWRFLATDIDAKSLQFARDNVARNGLDARIRVAMRSPDDPLVFTGDDSSSSSLDFTMSNPPFYACADEMAASAAAKKQPPHSACTGAPVEMVYAARDCGDGSGGEIAFVGRMLDESATLKTRVRWYTAMLGKLASLNELVGQLRARGIDNYAVAAFVHGTKTRRWALGWSYGARRPTVAAARGGSDSAGLDSYRHLLPPITEVDVLSVRWDAQTGPTALATATNRLMHGLALAAWDWDDNALTGTGRARENVWGRAWRRKKQREEKQAAVEGQPEPTEDPAQAPLGPGEECVFGFVVTVRVGVSETVVHCRWLEGHNEAIYQSFCGFLKDKLKESIISSQNEGK
jgi:23S rRNA (adenine1618-N6)-methyltransferase